MHWWQKACKNRGQTFHIHFGLNKYNNKNLKHEIDFIIKQNWILAEQRLKNQTDELMCKYKHGNNSHENEKQ